MAWRIHFTAEDLNRVRLGHSVGPLAETLLAFSFLRCPMQPQAMFAGWRSASIGKLTTEMAPLAALVPAGSRGVDLYTLTGETTTIEHGIMTLLGLSSQDMICELESFDRHHRMPSQAWATATDQGARRDLARAITAAYQSFVEPHWPRISAHLHAAQVAHRRVMASGGAEALLSSLRCPAIRWRSPVLELRASTSFDLRLNGRGIVIVPSMFAGRIASLHLDGRDPGVPPRLVLPAADASAGDEPGGSPAGGSAALAALLGRTRAAALRAIADGCTTSELAQLCDVSMAAASQHATVLRNAGLIITHRQGSSVLHVLTPLGADLLASEQASARASARAGAQASGRASAQSWPNASSRTSRPSLSRSEPITNGGRKRSTLP
jgi:DNA-binding transcriptional ArsR family regulator